MKKLILLAAAAGLVASSCTQRIVDFTIISTKNIDMTKSSNFQKGKVRTEGSDKVHIIIFIPTGTPNIKTAVDKAIEKIPGCVALLDGVVYGKFWWVPYVYGQSQYIVEGTPLIDPAMVMNKGLELPDYASIKFDNDGQVKQVKSVSIEDYNALKARLLKSAPHSFKNSGDLN